MKRLRDISPPVSAASPVFPGDTPFSRRWACTIAPGVPVNVSEVTLSLHVGAHADAPLHYDPQGEPAGLLDLDPYLGPCRVIHVIAPAGPGGRLVTWPDLAPACEGATPLPPRVLVRTYERAPSTWDPDLAAFAADAIEQLADRGVRLVGIDTASIDPAASKDLPSHQAVRRRGLRVLENLVLDDVPEGDYELIALPLRWIDADASPVRAVLRDL